MAIVFISPKEKQKIFILGIAGFFLLVLVLIGLAVFLARPKNVPQEQVFQAPEIKINFDVLKSEQIKNLEIPGAIEKEFSYKATTAKGQEQSGKISAPSQEKAIEILTTLGFSNITFEEAKSGRENPFAPFYEITPPKKGGKK